MAAAQKKRVMLVDDERGVLQLLKNRFESMGHLVAIIDNGADALQAAKRLKPDVIVLDQLMPSKSGLEICQELKANPETAKIPVLFFTAFSATGFEEECANYGAAMVFYKPVVGDLTQAVQMVLRGEVLKRQDERD